MPKTNEELKDVAQELRGNKRGQNTRDINRILQSDIGFNFSHKTSSASFWKHEEYGTFHFAETDPVDPRTAADLAKLIDRITGKTSGKEESLPAKEPFEFKNGLADLGERFGAFTLDGEMTLFDKKQPYITESFEVENSKELEALIRRKASELAEQSGYLTEMLKQAKEQFHIEVTHEDNLVRVTQPDLNITPIEVEKNSGYVGSLMQALTKATTEAEEIRENRFGMQIGLEEAGFKYTNVKKADWRDADAQSITVDKDNHIVVPYYGADVLTLGTYNAIEALIESEKSKQEALAASQVHQLSTAEAPLPQIIDIPVVDISERKPVSAHTEPAEHIDAPIQNTPLLPAETVARALSAVKEMSRAHGENEVPTEHVPSWQRVVRPESEAVSSGQSDTAIVPGAVIKAQKRAYTASPKESPVNTIDENSFGWRMTVHRNERRWTEARLGEAVSELLDRPVAQVNQNQIIDWSLGLAAPTEKEFKVLAQVLIHENDKLADKDQAMEIFERAYRELAEELKLPLNQQKRSGTLEFSRQLLTLRSNSKIAEGDLVSKINDKLSSAPVTAQEEKLLKTDTLFMARIERGAFDPSPGLASAIVRAFDEVSLLADKRPVRLKEEDKAKLYQAYSNRPTARLLEKSDEYTPELRAMQGKMQAYFNAAAGEPISQSEIAAKLNERLKPGDNEFPASYLGDLIGSSRKLQLPKFKNTRLVEAMADYLSDKSGREQAEAFRTIASDYYEAVDARRKDLSGIVTR